MVESLASQRSSRRPRRGRPRGTKVSENDHRYQIPTHESFRRTASNWHWNDLPYLIQHEILQQASFTIREEDPSNQSSSQPWLLSLARGGSALKRPSLAALYYAPSLKSHDQAEVFMKTLASDPPTSLRRIWVRYLSIEVYSTLMLGANVKLEDLLVLFPKLRGLFLEAQGDKPQDKRLMLQIPERSRGSLVTAKVIKAIEANGILLRSFKWTYLFDRRSDWPWRSLTKIHRTAFQSIQNLEILWYNAFFRQKDEDAFPTELSKALKVLPELQSLTFSFSNFHHKHDLLGNLPNTLKKVAFIDCEINCESLQICLEAIGSNLETLILQHNQGLNLDYLSVLEDTCPKLQHLEFNLSYYSSGLKSTSWALLVKNLLTTDLPLIWPSTLRHIEFKFLRGWGQEAAEIFLGSLQSAAPQLRDLRALILRMSVDLDWKERVAFRDKWRDRLELIYKRRCADPVPCEETNNWTNSSNDSAVYQRYSKRQRVMRQRGIEKTSSSTEHQPQGLGFRSSTRLSETKTVAQGKRATRSRKTTSDEEEEENEDETSLYIQGQCHKVEVMIDNLRPRESQFNEDDFLDSEKSGDEDWTGPGDDVEY